MSFIIPTASLVSPLHRSGMQGDRDHCCLRWIRDIPTQQITCLRRRTTVNREDGDAAQGAFVFTVKPSISAAPTAPLPTTMGTGSTPTWILLLVGAPALLVGLGSGWVLGRIRSGSARSGRTLPSNHEEEGMKRKSVI